MYACKQWEIPVCNKRKHCYIVCTCENKGKWFISGALIKYNANTAFKDRVGTNMPVLPIRLSSDHCNKIIFTLRDSGSKESLISRDLYHF